MILYGFPGCGKTYFARNLKETVKTTYINSDRIRGELFDKPRFDKSEDSIVNHILEYMSEEFLSAGVSVVLDINNQKSGHRRHLRDIAKKHKVDTIVVWFQIDTDSAFGRLARRDRRFSDDKYSRSYDRSQFDQVISQMQHPTPDENYIVLSGKHSFQMQRSTLLRKFFDMNLISPEDLAANVVKPGMVNLVPNSTEGTKKLHIR